MGRRLAGPVRLKKRGTSASDQTWFARYTIPSKLRPRAQAMGMGIKHHRSLGTSDHRQALLRWPSTYQQLQADTMAKLMGKGRESIKQQVQEALKHQVESEGRAHDPMSFFGAEDLAMVITNQRDGHPDHAQALALLRGEVTWADLVELHQQVALRSSGRPLSRAWHDQVSIAVRRAMEAGMTVPESVTKADVRRLMESMSCSATTRSKYLSLLSGLITTGIREDRLNLPANPFKQVSHSATTPLDQRRRAFTSGELEELFQGSQGDWFKLLVSTGLRVGELLSRDPRLHLEGQVLVIGDHNGWRPKTASSYRRVPVPMEMVPTVERLLPIRVSTLTQMAKLRAEVRRVSQDPRLVVHSTRHTFMTLARAQGVPLDVVEEITGHSKASRVSAGYGSYPDQVLIEAIEEIWASVSR